MKTAALTAALLLLPTLAAAQEHPRHALTVTVSGYSDGSLADVVDTPTSDWDRANFASLAYSYEFARLGPVAFEAEAQGLKHWGASSHWEGTAAVVARWTAFPWNGYLITTVAIGEGVSVASSIPAVERRKNRPESRVLNYLFFEATFALTSAPEVELVTRLHHRSGVGGLYNGVHDGSNYLGAGLRWRF